MKIVNVQPKTVVVANIPGAALMPWLDSVPAVLSAFLPGQQDGDSIARVLFGEVNPGGKLPLTFPMSDKQTPVNTTIQYPGIDNEANYTEELFVGYRWWDHWNIPPLFPFGLGLSYSSFNYSDLIIEGNGTLTGVKATVWNIGAYAGSEVAQLYLGFPNFTQEPPKVLRGFQKVYLRPGEEIQVSFPLTPQDQSIFDVTVNGWVLPKQYMHIFVGSSSRDIRLQGTYTYPNSSSHN